MRPRVSTFRIWVGFMVGIMCLGLAVLGHQRAHAQAVPATPRESKSELKALERKLDQVLANQQTILRQLETMMEELRIIKIRATR